MEIFGLLGLIAGFIAIIRENALRDRVSVLEQKLNELDEKNRGI